LANLRQMSGGAPPDVEGAHRQQPAVGDDEGQVSADPPAAEAAEAAGQAPVDENTDESAGERGGADAKRWLWALLAIAFVGLGIRVGYVVGWHAFDEVGGDAYYYHRGANLLADGKGFVHPFAYDEGVTIAGADHPPGYMVVLAVPSLVGLDSIRAHQIASCVIGAGTIVLIGLVGRRIAGRRAGLIAAAFAAVYPNMWLNDGALMSETLALFAGVAVILMAYRAWDRPDARRFAELGLTLGLASLARAEAVMLLGLLLVPLALWAPGLTGWRQRSTRAVLAGGVALLVMAPWVGANLVRFEHPATLSTQMGPTLDVANCDETFSGPALGAWSFGCATEIASDDRSVLDKVTREEAVDYVSEHRDRLPAVVSARFGRAWGLYAPIQNLELDNFFENRPLPAAKVGLGLYYVAVVASVVGIVALRRRGVPSFPLTAWLINVAVTVVVFYGSTRFRAPAEPALVLLAAVGIESLLPRRKQAGGEADAAAGTTTPPAPAIT
jgi:4-amino-4-deoxy-L-arabinose transferase-like glycosyltransferase